MGSGGRVGLAGIGHGNDYGVTIAKGVLAIPDIRQTAIQLEHGLWLIGVVDQDLYTALRREPAEGYHRQQRFGIRRFFPIKDVAKGHGLSDLHAAGKKDFLRIWRADDIDDPVPIVFRLGRLDRLRENCAGFRQGHSLGVAECRI